MFKNGLKTRLSEKVHQLYSHRLAADPYGKFVYSDSSSSGQNIQRINITCNSNKTCVTGSTYTLTGGDREIFSIGTYGQNVISTDVDGVKTYNTLAALIDHSSVGTSDFPASNGRTFNPRLICSDQNGIKYVFDERDEESCLWKVDQQGTWFGIITGVPAGRPIDMCHDFGTCIYLLYPDFIVYVISTDSEGIVNSVNIFANIYSGIPQSSDMPDIRNVYKSITVTPDGTVFVSDGSAVYSISPFADKNGNPLNDYPRVSIKCTNGRELTDVYIALNIQNIVAGSKTRTGYVDGSDALFNRIASMTSDIYGTIYVCDMASYAIRALVTDSSTGLINTVTLAGNGQSGLHDGSGADSQFIQPSVVRWTTLDTGVCVLYVLDDHSFIRMIY
jgi:hypothetical protein